MLSDSGTTGPAPAPKPPASEGTSDRLLRGVALLSVLKALRGRQPCVDYEETGRDDTA